MPSDRSTEPVPPGAEAAAAPEPAGTDGDPQEQTATEAAAVRALWPWVARRTRTQVVALVLISALALGPAFALLSILRADPTPVDDLLPATPTTQDVTRVTATATGLSPGTGELRARITVDPSAKLKDATGRLRRDVTVAVSGAPATTALRGESLSPFEVSLPLAQGTTTRYPFDSYRTRTVIVVSVDSGAEQIPQPVVIDAQSVVGDFVLSAAPLPEVEPGVQTVIAIDWTARRPATTTIYAIWLMVLMWGLAVAGLLIVWAVVFWMVDVPFWAFGFFVGVLFALPPLRDSLPGRPPPGTIFDFGSFYWSVTIIGVSLILLLSVWLHRTRAEHRLRDLDRTRPD